LNDNSILYFSHSDCQLHDMGNHHPESPSRLSAIEARLNTSPVFTELDRREAPKIDRDLLELAHSPEHIKSIFDASPSCGLVSIDADTSMTPHSLTAALRAAGAGVEAVKCIARGEGKKAFCAIRPPGHHAERHRAMGFCLFNNIAIAALYALNYSGFSRVAILDFDVHHGNGTEDIVRDDPRILLCSTFQHPLYPYSGADTTSEHIINSPLPSGTDGNGFRQAITTHWGPAIRRHKPELILISAGFDAHRLDPLANFNLSKDDYYWVTAEIARFARCYSEGRIMSVLEGGYHLDALAESVEAHLQAMAGK
jgi:acetoin utilization deacetylase AcuC-like enzyme